MTTKKRRTAEDESHASRELIIQFWQGLGEPPVDSRLLADIQIEMADKPCGSEIESPASIARVLADEGAELRHPGIIESDAEWREKQIQNHVKEFGGIELWIARSPLSLKDAEMFITTLENRRRESERTGDNSGLDTLRRTAIEVRRNAQAIGTNRNLDVKVRDEQTEFAQWLRVWLQTPLLFADWLELRRQSDEFQKKFSAEAP